MDKDQTLSKIKNVNFYIKLISDKNLYIVELAGEFLSKHQLNLSKTLRNEVKPGEASRTSQLFIHESFLV